MNRKRVLWAGVLIASIALLALYCSWAFNFYRNGSYGPYSQRYNGPGSGGYGGPGMMGRGFNPGGGQTRSGEKLSLDSIRSAVNEYIKGYGSNLEISDILVYKDSDYYVSIVEKDTGKGAMELQANPYTGLVYPEPGPGMMWNEKYRLRGGMMGQGGRRGYYGNNYSGSSVTVDKNQAVKAADEYVKNALGKDYSVPGSGHEFYGYYSFYISRNGGTVGIVSVNSYTGNVWYHDWFGQIEQVVSENKQ